MQKKRSWKKTIGLLVLVLFLVQTVSCGYFMYPGRRGQTGGRVDAGVAVMDGLCLLLFIIPGVVAFAVDFSSGAIYIPGSRAEQKNGETTVVLADPKDLNEAALEQIIHEQTGLTIELKNAIMKPLDAETPDRIGQVLDDLEQHGNIG
ncbi:hypothetical protein [Desulfatibacillum aliphaticivorans]|uniref:hypothetical protein n=1 Tax=Desulfatibacillum aliphaticivorans TaxID=218208 RepID=UPI0006852383|nr:hypothetical protein [Desulfatibacillum aliphaticivorans]